MINKYIGMSRVLIQKMHSVITVLVVHTFQDTIPFKLQALEQLPIVELQGNAVLLT